MVFTERESYKHKCAKEVFKSWCDKKCSESGDTRANFKTNMEYESGMNVGIFWRPNRDEGAWLEYPIVVDERVDSVQGNWDEIIDGLWYGRNYLSSDYLPVPSFDQCIELRTVPIAIVDVVLTHKGMPEYFIEICHKNPVSDEKKQKLKNVGVRNLIELDADWILSQVGIPEVLKIKRWLL